MSRPISIFGCFSRWRSCLRILLLFRLRESCGECLSDSLVEGLALGGSDLKLKGCGLAGAIGSSE